MKYKIFAVYDSKAEAYMTPFFMNKTEQARRSFADACQNPDLPFGRHPGDYTLFEIGAFNDHNAELTPQNPISRGTALELNTQGNSHAINNDPSIQPGAEGPDTAKLL